MATNSFPGGRAKKAPYSTTHIRIPDTLKTKVSKLVEIYRLLLSNNQAVGLANFEVQLDKFIEGYSPLYGVVTDDFKVIDARQFEELKILYYAMLQKNKDLRSREQSNAYRKTYALSILDCSLKLKANSGGAIKREIEKAIAELKEIN